MPVSEAPTRADHSSSSQIPGDLLQFDESALIAVVDDDDGVRRSTACTLESEGYRVLLFASGDAFLRAELPDDLSCVVLDLRMPGRTGLDVLRRLAERGSAPPVIMLTGHADIGSVVEAMKLRAADVIEKPCQPNALLRALLRAQAIARESGAAGQIKREAAARVARLTRRQQEVLRGIVHGDPNKIIAWRLGLSVRTVEAYRAQLFEKLRVRSTAEAVRIAITAGLQDGAPAAPGQPRSRRD